MRSSSSLQLPIRTYRGPGSSHSSSHSSPLTAPLTAPLTYRRRRRGSGGCLGRRLELSAAGSWPIRWVWARRSRCAQHRLSSALMALITSDLINGPDHLGQTIALLLAAKQASEQIDAPAPKRPAKKAAAAVSASLSTRQIWTALQHDGRNHLGLWLIRQRRPRPSLPSRSQPAQRWWLCPPRRCCSGRVQPLARLPFRCTPLSLQKAYQWRRRESDSRMKELSSTARRVRSNSLSRPARSPSPSVSHGCLQLQSPWVIPAAAVS